MSERLTDPAKDRLQARVIRDICNYFRTNPERNNSAVLHMPCGAGKSATGVKIVSPIESICDAVEQTHGIALEDQLLAVVTVPQVELIRQWKKEFQNPLWNGGRTVHVVDRHSQCLGKIARLLRQAQRDKRRALAEGRPFVRPLVLLVQTFQAGDNLGDCIGYHPVFLYIADEAHHLSGDLKKDETEEEGRRRRRSLKQYLLTKKDNGITFSLHLTATPRNVGLDRFSTSTDFGEVFSVSGAELVQAGIIMVPKPWAVLSHEWEACQRTLKKFRDDPDSRQALALARAFLLLQLPERLGLFEHRILAFFNSNKTAKACAAAFAEAAAEYEEATGRSPNVEARSTAGSAGKRNIAWFKGNARVNDGRLRVLTSVNMVGQGYDDSSLEVVAICENRDVKSGERARQTVGRAIRTFPGKTQAHVFCLDTIDGEIVQNAQAGLRYLLGMDRDQEVGEMRITNSRSGGGASGGGHAPIRPPRVETRPEMPEEMRNKMSDGAVVRRSHFVQTSLQFERDPSEADTADSLPPRESDDDDDVGSVVSESDPYGVNAYGGTGWDERHADELMAMDDDGSSSIDGADASPNDQQQSPSPFGDDATEGTGAAAADQGGEAGPAQEEDPEAEPQQEPHHQPRRRLPVHPLSADQLALLPEEIDMERFENFLRNEMRVTPTNLRRVMNSIRKFASGEGVFCQNTQNTFMAGRRLKFSDDVRLIRKQAIAWEKDGENTDPGNGYKARHPLNKLCAFQHHVYETMFATTAAPEEEEEAEEAMTAAGGSPAEQAPGNPEPEPAAVAPVETLLESAQAQAATSSTQDSALPPSTASSAVATTSAATAAPSVETPTEPLRTTDAEFARGNAEWIARATSAAEEAIRRAEFEGGSPVALAQWLARSPALAADTVAFFMPDTGRKTYKGAHEALGELAGIARRNPDNGAIRGMFKHKVKSPVVLLLDRWKSAPLPRVQSFKNLHQLGMFLVRESSARGSPMMQPGAAVRTNFGGPWKPRDHKTAIFSLDPVEQIACHYAPGEEPVRPERRTTPSVRGLSPQGRRRDNPPPRRKRPRSNDDVSDFS